MLIILCITILSMLMFNLGYEIYSLIRPKIPWSTEEFQLHHRQPMDRENHWLWRISVLREQETLLRQENGGIQRLRRVILDTNEAMHPLVLLWWEHCQIWCDLCQYIFVDLLWTCPEILRADEICPRNGSRAGDVYSYGIILHETFYRCGTFPVSGKTAKGWGLLRSHWERGEL